LQLQLHNLNKSSQFSMTCAKELSSRFTVILHTFPFSYAMMESETHVLQCVVNGCVSCLEVASHQVQLYL